MPVSKFISLTETCYYLQFNDGIVVHKGDSYSVYHNKAHTPAHLQDQDSKITEYPFGWTKGIESYCQQHGYHPDCKDPIRRSFIEQEFLVHTINDPDSLTTLDEYLCTILSHCGIQPSMAQELP